MYATAFSMTLQNEPTSAIFHPVVTIMRHSRVNRYDCRYC